MSDKYRVLTSSESKIMEERGCVSEDWSRVLVVEDFIPDRFKNTAFYGDIRLGRMDMKIDSVSGISRKCGIYNSAIHNCIIKDNVYIRNVSNYISNYIIEDNVIIDDVNTLEVTGLSRFGNGTRVAVINESGGREIPIYDRLSAHEAYVMALYRHRSRLVKRMFSMVDAYAESVKSATGVVAKGAHISNCGNIRNVKIGSYAELRGIVRLTNGTINSNSSARTTVGAGVIADDFIMATGSSVEDGVIIDHCFIGQGTELAKQYSAENSVFFANCGGFHGEACSIFAGPYTVTHHKSTLLIAGMFSFMNAGSGSNQSNHMYKLGPVHQGILERGTKTTSNSYIVFPARVGAFTLIMGRHTANSDTSELPYSYLIEENDESVIVPGVNIRSVGTVRDSKKWPRRDKRLDTDVLDFITFYLLTPYTVQKMMNGKALLENLRDSSGNTVQKYYYNGVRIARNSLNKGIQYYDLGITRFVGNVLVTLLQTNRFRSLDELRSLFSSGNPDGRSEWLDMAGLIVPKKAVDKLFVSIENEEITELSEIGKEFRHMYDNYSAYEIAWVTDKLEDKLGKKFSEFTAGDIIGLLDDWIDAVETLDQMRTEDARKEFSATAMVGFGIDGDESDKKADFAEVRGEADTNDFMVQLRARLRLKKDTVRVLKKRLSAIEEASI